MISLPRTSDSWNLPNGNINPSSSTRDLRRSEIRKRAPCESELSMIYAKSNTNAKRKRKRILDQQFGKCALCGNSLVDVRQLKKSGCEIVFLDRQFVVWYQDESLMAGLVATVDHKISKRRWAKENYQKSPHCAGNLQVLCRHCHDKKAVCQDN